MNFEAVKMSIPMFSRGRCGNCQGVGVKAVKGASLRGLSRCATLACQTARDGAVKWPALRCQVMNVRRINQS